MVLDGGVADSGDHRRLRAVPASGIGYPAMAGSGGNHGRGRLVEPVEARQQNAHTGCGQTRQHGTAAGNAQGGIHGMASRLIDRHLRDNQKIRAWADQYRNIDCGKTGKNNQLMVHCMLLVMNLVATLASATNDPIGSDANHGDIAHES